MEYTDSLWAHLGGDTDVSSQSEVDQWLEEALDEAEDDNLDTEGVDNEPLSETTWNSAARRAILKRTASGEPDFIEAARRIIANGAYETVDGMMFDTFSASAVLGVYDALNDENKEKMAGLGLAQAVNVAFKLINKGRAASRKQANAGLTCPTCGEPVEPTPSGMYSHVNSLTGPCGIRIMDTAQRPDGTFTDEDDLVDQGLADPDMYDFSGYEGSRSAMVTPMSRKQAQGPYYVAVDRLEDGSRTYKGPYSDTAAAQREADAWNNAESSYEGRSWIAIVVSGPEALADFKAWQKATKKGQPWEDQKRYFPNTASRKTAKSARDVVAGDVISGPGSGYSPTGTDSGTVSKVDSTTTPGTVYIYFGDHGPPADLIFNHGDPVRISSESRRRTAADPGLLFGGSVEVFDESEGYSFTMNVSGDTPEAAINEAVRQNPLFCSSGGWFKFNGTTYSWTRTGEYDSAGAIVSAATRKRAARAGTQFTICPAHQSWFAGTSRYRTGEVFAEGGPGSGPPCTGDGCKIKPGTDIFTADLCDAEYNTMPGSPFAWGVNSAKTATRKRAAEEAMCRHCGRPIVLEDGRWVDPEATGDDSIWRETCDSHDTFTAEHEPESHTASRMAADDSTLYDPVGNRATDGGGDDHDDDEEELYDDWAHDDNGYDPSVDDPDRWRWQSGQTGVSSFATRTALTSVDDEELIDWDRRKREEQEGLVDWGGVQPQSYEKELKTHIYSDSQRRGR